MKNFELALVHVLKSEGGYVSHSLDAGRETNMGITRATLERFRGKEVTAEDVMNLTRGEAAEIYLKHYWLPYNLDQINNPIIAAAVFDQVVNRRASEVIRGIQVVLTREFPSSGVEPDGVMGPVTIRALNQVRPEKMLTLIVIEAQRAYLAIVDRSPNQAVFLKGWIARTWRLLQLV